MHRGHGGMGFIHTGLIPCFLEWNSAAQRAQRAQQRTSQAVPPSARGVDAAVQPAQDGAHRIVRRGVEIRHRGRLRERLLLRTMLPLYPLFGVGRLQLPYAPAVRAVRAVREPAVQGQVVLGT